MLTRVLHHQLALLIDKKKGLKLLKKKAQDRKCFKNSMTKGEI